MIISRRSLILAAPAIIVSNSIPSISLAACPPQYPALLNGEAIRPPWKIAGVDYGVGFSPGQANKTPGVTPAPAGVIVDAAAHKFTVTGNNVALDGWDFSINGGWGVFVQGNNCSIKRCNLKSGANGYNPLDITGASATVQFCVLDSNNINPVNGFDGSFAPNTIRFAGGANVLQYCWLKNGYWDWIDIHGGAGLTSTYLIKDNLLDQCCQTTDVNSHCDWLQTYADDGYAQINMYYNTCRQVSFQPNVGSQGWTCDANANQPPARFGSVDFSYNTIYVTTPGNGMSYVLSCDRSITNSITINNNFLDLSGFDAGGLPPFKFRNIGGAQNAALVGTGNTNMVNNTQPASWNF